jgi:hypothetical protein
MSRINKLDLYILYHNFLHIILLKHWIWDHNPNLEHHLDPQLRLHFFYCLGIE